jgi:hypothetical protein
MTRTALMATCATRREHVAEAEPVVVETDADVVRLELDQGSASTSIASRCLRPSGARRREHR